MEKFLFLGSSDYALRILERILKTSETKPFALIDNNMDENKKTYILKRGIPYLNNENLLDSLLLSNSSFHAELISNNLSIALCVNFSKILRKEFLAIFSHGVINLHQSFLPYNRGHWPEVWSIINNTPAGVTLHYMNETIDTGNIITQVEVPIFSKDTGKTLCDRIEKAGLDLVESSWNLIMLGKISEFPQKKKYPMNTRKDLEDIMEIDLNETYRAGDLLNTLRALTMPGFLPGGYFIDSKTKEKIFINVSLNKIPLEHTDSEEK